MQPKRGEKAERRLRDARHDLDDAAVFGHPWLGGLVDAARPLDKQAAVDEPLEVHAVDAEPVQFDAADDPLAADQFKHSFSLGSCGHERDELSAFK